MGVDFAGAGDDGVWHAGFFEDFEGVAVEGWFGFELVVGADGGGAVDLVGVKALDALVTVGVLEAFEELFVTTDHGTQTAFGEGFESGPGNGH